LKRWLKEKHPDWIRIMRLLAYEFEGAQVGVISQLSPRRQSRLKSLSKQKNLKLHIASGASRRPGWVNIDVHPNADVRMDLRRPLPFADGSASLIFCEHFCDHLEFPTTISAFLKECARVLEVGGRARFIMHDARDLMRAYVDRDVPYFEKAEHADASMIESVNHLFRFNDFHRFLYDYELFEALLKRAGFTSVTRCAYRQSAVPELVLDFEAESREVMSMFIEAVR
jgi:predicted SAM-dependent methyltransferase